MIIGCEETLNILVNDDKTVFIEKDFNSWLSDIGSGHLVIAPRHPQSSGLAESYVST